MTLNICWFLPLPAAAIAEARGLYTEHGLAVTAQTVRSSDEQYELLATGAAQAGVTAMDNVFDWNRRGAVDDLRIVAQMERTTGSVLMGAAGIDTMAKLKGGTLLVDAPNNGFVVVTRAMLRGAGLELDDYRLEVVGGVMARVAALEHGTGDAALLVPLFEQRILAAGGHVLGRVDESFPGFPGQGLAVRRSALNNIGPELAAWLDALREAGRWATANPAEAEAIVMDKLGLPQPAAAGLLAATPLDYRPAATSLELVVSQRSELGFPGAEEGMAALFDPTLLGHRPA